MPIAASDMMHMGMNEELASGLMPSFVAMATLGLHWLVPFLLVQ